MEQANVELVLRGYRAFVAGDLDAIAEMLHPEVQWNAIDPESSTDHGEVLRILAQRFADGYRLELERCIPVGDKVVVAFRASGIERDLTDDRLLQTRRYFTVGRYSAVVTIRDGRVAHVQDYPHLDAALASVGLEAETEASH